MSRTYSKILRIFELSDYCKMCNFVIRRRYKDVFGYEPKRSYINSNLSRAVKDGVLTRDENGFYAVK